MVFSVIVSHTRPWALSYLISISSTSSTVRYLAIQGMNGYLLIMQGTEPERNSALLSVVHSLIPYREILETVIIATVKEGIQICHCTFLFIST